MPFATLAHLSAQPLVIVVAHRTEAVVFGWRSGRLSRVLEVKRAPEEPVQLEWVGRTLAGPILSELDDERPLILLAEPGMLSGLRAALGRRHQARILCSMIRPLAPIQENEIVELLEPA